MKYRAVDFVSLRLIVECSEKGCLTAAARECNLTVSAASRRLRLFEEMVDCRIFERCPNGLKLIAEAEHVVLTFREILEKMSGLMK